MWDVSICVTHRVYNVGERGASSKSQACVGSNGDILRKKKTSPFIAHGVGSCYIERERERSEQVLCTECGTN